MTRKDALEKIKELEEYIERLDNPENDKIFLLSVEDFIKYRIKIPLIHTRWWLSTQGEYIHTVSFIDDKGEFNEIGSNTFALNFGIRPALKYDDIPKSEIAKSMDRDCFVWKEVKWKILDEDEKLAIAYIPMRFDMFDKKDVNYAKSYIRGYLLEWYDTIS